MPTVDGEYNSIQQEQSAEFGPVETQKLSNIQKVGARLLSRNWSNIPHVTHHDEADITDVEGRRSDAGRSNAATRTSALSVYAKAVATALLAFPKFNASLDDLQGAIILKKYIHLGFAIDAPNGLLVGVVRDCDSKSALSIGTEVASLAAKARSRGLSYAEMTGSTFTITSLGARGGISFTPIINAQEVAILGISRIVERPARGPEGGVIWRQMLPLSLSYDHRVINGADASNFMTRLKELISESYTL